MKHNLMEMINNRMHKLVREAGFKGTVVMEDIDKVYECTVEDAVYAIDPTEESLIEATRLAIFKEFSAIVIFY